MKNDLLCAMPTRPLFHQVEKKTRLKNDYFTCQGGFLMC